MNGSDPIENGVDGVDGSKADDQPAATTNVNKPGKDKDGDEEMTVVVPPPKASKLTVSSTKDDEDDIAMNGVDEPKSETKDDVVDPQAEAVGSTCS